MKKVFFAIFTFLHLIAFSANEEVVSSFQSGTSIGSNQPLSIGAVVTTQDGWYSYMNLNNPGYLNFFKIKENSAIVRLRYDDSKKFNPGVAWSLTVTYNIELFDINNTTTPFSTLTGEMLTINYLSHSSPSNYIDIALKKYSNAPKVRVTITNVQFTPGGPPIPNIYEDIYLDVIENTERYYVLSPTTPVNVSAQSGFVISNPNGNSKVQLPIAWSFIYGAESYDVEWLFIDAGNNHFTNNYNFNFKNATRVNVLDNHYEIQLAYPAGIILYRVRPVGYDYNGTDLIKVEGAWSFASAGTTFINAPAINTAYRYDFAGLDPAKNWNYSSSYSEEGKRKEAIGYFDGALQPRQMTTVNYEQDNIVITEPILDYEGREAGKIVPTPTVHAGLKYYASGSYNGFNPNYNPFDFDQDININNPPPLPTTAGASKYYSVLNNTGGMHSAYISDAQGYPFTRTTFLTDGTGRVKSQSNVGYDLRTGSGREMNYIYGKPSTQPELDRLFGNEVGYMNNYFKKGVKDENGQTQVTYLDNHGRVIASCLAGSPPSNLYELDNKPPISPIAVNILDDNNTVNSQNHLVSSQFISVFMPTLYKFKYDINPTNFCKNCKGGYQICSDCMYDIEISIRDQDGFLVNHINITSSTPPVTPANANPIVITNVNSGSVDFEIMLQPGVYTVDKVLKVNQGSLNTLTNQFINDQLLNPRCFSYPRIQPESCLDGCKKACEERYTRFNFLLQQYYYVDDNEVVITAAQANTLIATCEQTCKSPQYPEAGDQCTLKLLALKKDMSPGGQYFSNTIVQFTNDPVQGIIENPAYQAQKYDWLNTNLAAQAPGIFSAFSASAGVTISSWADVETNWQPAFADHLVLFHPEYCAYKYFCDGQIVCGEQGTPGSSTISISASNSYDYLLTHADYTTALANGYFNTINYPLSTSHSTLDFINGNVTYCSYTAAVSPNLDPFIQSCNVSLSKCNISPAGFMAKYFKSYLDIGTGNYVSIWYVLDDPDNIHLIATASSTTPPQPVIDFFKQLHGDGTTTNPGLFATTSKWDYLKSVYLFYKQLFIYDYYSKYACPLPSIKKPLSTQPQSVSLVNDQFTIHYPKNPIFEALMNASGTTCDYFQNPMALANSFTTTTSNALATTCDNNCSGAADTWMQQLSGCSLTPTQLADIKFYLIEVCKKECNSSNIQGTSGCNPPSSTCTYVAGPGGAQFYTFADVINHFSSGSCQVTIHHPPAFNDANCSCATLNQYINENGLSLASNASIATALNNSFSNATSYTASDVANWRNACNLSTVTTTLLSSFNYPASFICSTQKSAYDEIGCSCSKISQFINQIGYDPANTAHYPFIVSAINNYFGIPLAQQINVTQLTFILSNCATGGITNYADFQSNNIPEILLCPAPASTNPEDIQAAQDLANCMQIQLAIATAQAVQLYNQIVTNQTLLFQQTYTNFCLNAAKTGKESFLMDYLLDEFKYTLYYYDQAGTLVKTVAPEGVELIVNPLDLQAVKDYRNGITTTPFFPPHRMVTRSKYDTYNQKIEHDSPDGGLTYYWYDNKGRAVNSQTSRQRNTLPTAKYSYNSFESIGNRISETGELKQVTPLTQKIARDRDPSLTYAAWRAAAVGSEVQITKTYYDVPIALTPNPFGTTGQINTRNLVTNITYQQQYGANYDQGLHYSYDVNGFGNVYVQENNYLDPSSSPVVPVSERFKTIRVQYTPADRNIHEVQYQDGQADRYYQRFLYDKDNSLVRVYSSTDKLIWETDAKYFFYKHSSLARTEYGDKQVQGCDFAYTMQTWLKGMNSTLISPVRDIGKDANPPITNINNRFPIDAFAYTNGYFKNDYLSITPSINTPPNNFIADPFFTSNSYGDYIYNTGSNPRNFNLYNGSISNSAFAELKTDGTVMEVLGNSYIYDQAYRLKERYTFKDPALIANNYWTGSAVTAEYKEEFNYDYNGNIYNAVRDAVTTGNVPLPMDILDYKYQLDMSGKRVNNKMYGISDPVPAANYSDDIDTQPSTFTGGPPDSDPGLNYWYDENGQLIKDRSEGILSVEYTHFGAIKKINRDPGFYKQIGIVYFYPSDIEFFYDANGRRCMKLEIPREGVTGNPTLSTPKAQIYWIYTIYNYDVSGNVASVYVKQWNGSAVDFRLKEQYTYGSGRTAQISKNIVLPASPPPTNTAQRELGLKSFEMKGNAGNIYSTIADYKVSAFTSGTTVVLYRAIVLENKDYFAFGTPMPNRNFVNKPYRYGSNGGSEKDREVMMGKENMYGTYFRELDSRSARWWSMDPVFNPSESPYAVNHNHPVSLSDPLGDMPLGQWLKQHTSTNVRFMIEKDEYGWSYSAAASGGLSFAKDHLNLSLNLSVRYYEGGLGSTGSGDRQIDFVATPAFAYNYALKKKNFDRGVPIQQNIFNSYSAFAVDNKARNSLLYGINFVWNGEGRHQAVAGFMLKFNRVIISSANDVYGLDGDDRWWTGSFHLGYNFTGINNALGKLGFVSFGYDAFTGERIVKNPDGKTSMEHYQTYTSGGYIYYSQSLRDLELTNGMPAIFLKSTGIGRRAYYTGGTKKGFFNPMWLQNTIHDNYPTEQLPRFQSIAPFLLHFVKYN
ncbi:MAG: hypothetical protein K0S32_1228 [Bacteroidetes bacterium]|jgi:hypothetical protein|nr:hypothetical protein [Bacteroidota bacterium]